MAKAFRFRAQTVLRLREQREQAAQRRFAEIQARVSQAQDGIRRTREEIAQQDAAARDGVLTGTVDVQYISLYRRHTMVLHRSLLQQAQQLQQVAGELAQARVELIEAARQRKVMSRLKEKQREQYDDQLERLERLEADEMAAVRFAFLHSDDEGPSAA